MIAVSYEVEGREISICVENDSSGEKMFGHGAVPKECPPEHVLKEAVRSVVHLVNECMKEMHL